MALPRFRPQRLAALGRLGGPALFASGAAATAAALGSCAVVSAQQQQQQQQQPPAGRTRPLAAVRVVCEDHLVGTGAVVESGETVHVHYEGRLESFDGPVFDSSYASGEPLLFKVDSDPVIQGWHDGIRGMRVGGRRKITIPAELAYGSKGIKDPARNRWVVPPRATLYFR